MSFVMPDERARRDPAAAVAGFDNWNLEVPPRSRADRPRRNLEVPARVHTVENRNYHAGEVSTLAMRPDTNLTSSRAPSDHDLRMTRPRAAIRVAILIAAVACLGLAMCARNRPPANPPAQVAPAPKPEPAPDPRTFPATKAPGRLY
jgi:hypothetical protein